jgi:hypothetical protein
VGRSNPRREALYHEVWSRLKIIENE